VRPCCAADERRLCAAGRRTGARLRRPPAHRLRSADRGPDPARAGALAASASGGVGR
jgi:hypothetical protein